VKASISKKGSEEILPPADLFPLATFSFIVIFAGFVAVAKAEISGKLFK
jgi:hypothetical protein